MKKILIIVALTVCVANSFSAKNTILKNELSKREKDFYENNSQSQSEIENQNNQETNDNAVVEEPKFFIKEIFLKKSMSFDKPIVSEKKLNRIIKSYENSEMGTTELRELVKKLNEVYEKK